MGLTARALVFISIGGSREIFISYQNGSTVRRNGGRCTRFLPYFPGRGAGPGTSTQGLTSPAVLLDVRPDGAGPQHH